MTDPGKVTRLVDRKIAPWRKSLLLNEKKAPRALLANALIALREAPEWRGVLTFDDFNRVTECANPPPWLRGSNGAWTPCPWLPTDDVLA